MKKRWMLMTVLGTACVLLISCGRTEKAPEGSGEAGAQSAYHKITAEEAKKMMDEREDEIVLDVRTREEYEQGHIAGAVLLPNETIGEEMPEELPDQDQVILVYCRTGVRSGQASRKLVSLGYTGVYDMGGIRDWPYETVSEDT